MDPPGGEALLSPTGPDNKDHLALGARTYQNGGLGAWVRTCWPLVVHGIFAIGVASFTLAYVDENHFNFNERRPSLSLADGSTVQSGFYAPLQSDITTLLSVLLAILRLITASWLGPLCWRCAFILMEGYGLKPKQLHRLISYGLPTMPRRGWRGVSLLTWIILAIVLPAYFAAPLLTGSITWAPSNHPPMPVTDAIIRVGGLNTPSDAAWQNWARYPNIRKKLVNRAAGLPLLSWGRDSHNGVLKRVVLPAARLGVNSTLANITLPYFSVAALEWIEDPQRTLTSDQLSLARVACPKLNISDDVCPLLIVDRFSLIPDAPWTNLSFPPPRAVSETRLLALFAASRGSAQLDGAACGRASWEHGYLLPNISTAPDPDYHACWAFAWVTYSAGVGVCNNCRVSSYATVQNDTALTLHEDHLTNAALQLMPTVISTMIDMNSSSLAPTWENVDDYIIGYLTRSYAGAWMAVTSYLDETYGHRINTSYSVSARSSQAQVDVRRVYIWLAFQSLVTISGLLFFYVQRISDSPMIVDTTLAAFFLDSSDVQGSAEYDQLRGGAPRKAEFEGSLLKVKVD